MVTIQDTKKYLTELFFVSGKNGLREGIRRLSILVGIIGSYFIYDDYSTMAQMAADSFTRWTGAGTGLIAYVILSFTVAVFVIVSFFVVAGAIKFAGWVLEGFFKQ